MRGVAALSVARSHITQSPVLQNGLASQLLEPVRNYDGILFRPGDLFFNVVVHGGNMQVHPGVLFFFVLSGFVLTSSIVKDEDAGQNTFPTFLVRRVCRIYPAVFFAIAAFLIVFAISGVSLSSPDVFAPLPLAMNALLVWADIDGPTWSLRAELVALPVIWLLATHGARNNLMLPSAIALVLCGLYFWGGWVNLITPRLTSVTAYQFAFVLGTIAFLASRHMDIGRRGNGIALVVVGMAFLLVPYVTGPGSLWTTLAQAGLAAIFIALLAFSADNPVKKILRLRVLRFLGRISFSFYLLHPLTLIVAWNIPGMLGEALSFGLSRTGLAMILTTVSILATVPIAAISYRVIERPFIDWSKRMRSVTSPALVL